MKKLIAVLFFTVFIYGSNGKLVGTIVQKSDNSPAVGVNIILVDTYLGAASDEQGKFVVLNIESTIIKTATNINGKFYVSLR